MSNEESKPQQEPGTLHREKQTMTEPQEEFVGDKPQPSKDVSGEEASPKLPESMTGEK
jgi:hypothetical protein